MLNVVSCVVHCTDTTNSLDKGKKMRVDKKDKGRKGQKRKIFYHSFNFRSFTVNLELTPLNTQP